MSNTITRTFSRWFLAIAATIMIAAPLALTAPAASADTFTTDDFFSGGGDYATADGFATDIGLGTGDLVDSITSIIRVALGFLGIIAVVIILLGGFKWMTAGGNDDKVKDAKKLIFSGIIGLVIVLSAYAIAEFVIDAISTATT